jgi:hypothetical protein
VTEASAGGYARTARAAANRLVKARRLARWCRRYGFGPEDVLGWPGPVRGRVARAVGVNPPGDGSPTWLVVAGLLERMAGWAAAHPGDPRGRQDLTGQRPDWTLAGESGVKPTSTGADGTR